MDARHIAEAKKFCEDIARLSDGEIACRLADIMSERVRWKDLFIPFAILHAAPYGKNYFGDGYLYPTHYDLLKEAGARMDDFKRASVD